MNKVILIVDDDKELRTLLKVGLEKENFAVVAAESAEDAAEILVRMSVDGIVLDRMMGGRDGLSFLQMLRKCGDKTPVIMLTAMTGGDNAIDGLAGGADDYLAKPFKLGELVLRLRNITRGGKAAKMPTGLSFVDDEFFVGKKLFSLSITEKAAMLDMIAGRTAPMPPMTAKRLRDKVLANIENADIINVRGKGYKLVSIK